MKAATSLAPRATPRWRIYLRNRFESAAVVDRVAVYWRPGGSDHSAR